MGQIEHLDEKKLDKICMRLNDVEGSLNGMGALFQQQSVQTGFEDDELFGVGQLLKVLSRELSALNDVLRCGYDSQAIKK